MALKTITAEIADRRDHIRSRAVQSLKDSFPFEGKHFTVDVEDIQVKPAEVSPVTHKKAILQARTLSEPVRGTLVLKDNSTGKVVQRIPNFNLLQLPYFTDHSTFVIAGSTYSVSNQLRMKPGVYTRKRKNEELEAGFNLSKGDNFRLSMDPESGHFKIEYGTTKIPLYPVLQKLGVPDKDIAQHWNRDLVELNRGAFEKNSVKYLDKMYERLVPYYRQQPGEDKVAAIKRTLRETRMDPEINQRTLGQPFARVDTDALLAASGKLLKAYQADVDFDERDSLAFKKLMTVDDFIGERIALDARGIRRKVVDRLNLGQRDLLRAMPPSPFTKSIHKFLSTSQLSNNPDQINPVEMLDASARVTSLGEGGIENLRAVPEEARRLHTSHLGALDPVRTPETDKVGIDLRATMFTKKDDNGNIYVPVFDLKKRKMDNVSVTKLVDSVVAFPNQKMRGTVDVVRNNRVEAAPATQVDYLLPSVQSMYSPAANLVPFINNIDGNRKTMGSKMQTQALPLDASEPPLVQAASHVPGRSMEQLVADMIVPHAPISGTIHSIKDGFIHVRPLKKTAAAGVTVEKVPYHENFPLAAKTYLNDRLQVKTGDTVKKGQPLAESAFVKDGQLALGKNLLTAYMPWRGLNSNDAIVVSEGAANKLTSLHMYKKALDVERDMKLGRETHKTYYGNAYEADMYKKLDKDGIATPGTTVQKGDLLVAALRKSELSPENAMLGKLHKSLVRPFRDASVVWDHDMPGEVTDVMRAGNKIRMTVKTKEPLRVGDKLCFTEDAEVLTKDGWKCVSEVTLNDVCYTLNTKKNQIELQEPTALHTYPTAGELYELSSQQVDLRVTSNHNLYVRERGSREYQLIEAEAVLGKRVCHAKTAAWCAATPELFTLPIGNIPVRHWLRFLGAYLANGSAGAYQRADRPGSVEYRVSLHTIRGVHHSISGNQHTWLKGILDECGFPYTEKDDRLEIHSKQLAELLVPLGHATDKTIPAYVFGWGKDAAEWVLTGLLGCDGHKTKSGSLGYTTTSQQLADDVQRLALHAGWAANITVVQPRNSSWHTRYNVKIVRTRCFPQINHGHHKTQYGQIERIRKSDEPVYGITVPNGVLYVRVNGKPVFTGNSGRFGNKGVVSTIVPDEQMVKDEAGNTVDVVLTSAGVVSRVNPGQILETAMGKVAQKIGKPIHIENYTDEDNVTWVKNQLKKHGIKDKETLFDPVTGKSINDVFVGPQYTFKLFKSTETNYSARGVEDYDVNQQPSGGGPTGAKGLGSMEVNALLAHGARNVLQEATALKSQKNDEYWRAFQLGLPLPAPKTTFAFDRFGSMLAGSGIKLNKQGNHLRLAPLTDAEIMKMAPDEVATSKDMHQPLFVLAKNLRPEKGGLFDPTATGGTSGTKWSHIALTEPIVNPVFEKPVQTLLGMTKREFDDTVQQGGGAAFKAALGAIDVKAERKNTEDEIKRTSGAVRDKAIRRLKVLSALEHAELSPDEAYVISKLPVVPPVYRPILPSKSGSLQISDPNHLYRDAVIADRGLLAAKENLTDREQGAARKHMYDATKALFGVPGGEPVSPQAKARNVQGFLARIAGTGRSPKTGYFQSKLVKRRQDVSGRGTIVPDATLSLDEVGLPEDMAWSMYAPFLIRRMVQRGYSAVDAREKVEQHHPSALEILQQEVKERPVLLNRAPSLRRYNVLAAYPRLVPGKSIRIHELFAPIQAGDFDGDTMQVHVPVSSRAVEEAKGLTLSRMLLGDQYKKQTLVVPQHESIMGIYRATNQTPVGETKTFKTKADAVAAYNRGEIGLNTPVKIGKK